MALHGMSMDGGSPVLPPGDSVFASCSRRCDASVRERFDWCTTYPIIDWMMLGFDSSRDIVTVVPRGWCSGETFYLGLAVHRPACLVGSWAGVVWLDQHYSNLLVSLARMRRRPSRVVDVVAAYGGEHPPAGLFLAVCLVCQPQSSKGSCMICAARRREALQG